MHCVYVFNTEYASGSASTTQTTTCDLETSGTSATSGTFGTFSLRTSGTSAPFNILGKQINLTV